MSLIGSKCKRGDTFSLRVLIGRGLFLFTSFRVLASHYALFSSKLQKNWKNRLTNHFKCGIIVKQLWNAPLAQLVEQLTLNQWVLGSSPRWCTKQVGAYSDEVTPVPIPNTEVKLIRVDDTWLVTARETKSVPTLIIIGSYDISFRLIYEGH